MTAPTVPAVPSASMVPMASMALDHRSLSHY